VQRLKSASDAVSAPVVRRVLDGAVIAMFIANLLGRPQPGFAAAADSPGGAAVVEQVPIRGGIGVLEFAPDQAGLQEYTVQPGDTLWSISEQFYGDGAEYPRLLAVNLGRIMPDGLRFTHAGIICPGWVLLVPQEEEAIVSLAAEQHTRYVVK